MEITDISTINSVVDNLDPTPGFIVRFETDTSDDVEKLDTIRESMKNVLYF